MTAFRPPPTFDGLGPTVTVPEAAAILGISRGSMYMLLARGEAPVRPLRLGRRIVISTAALRRVLEADG